MKIEIIAHSRNRCNNLHVKHFFTTMDLWEFFNLHINYELLNY